MCKYSNEMIRRIKALEAVYFLTIPTYTVSGARAYHKRTDTPHPLQNDTLNFTSVSRKREQSIIFAFTSLILIRICLINSTLWQSTKPFTIQIPRN